MIREITKYEYKCDICPRTTTTDSKDVPSGWFRMGLRSPSDRFDIKELASQALKGHDCKEELREAVENCNMHVCSICGEAIVKFITHMKDIKNARNQRTR